MRTLLLAGLVALLGTACYSSAPGRYYTREEASAQPAAFDAYTTSGDFVRVQKDARTGDLVIVEPASLAGERVALVGGETSNGAPLVTISSARRRAAVRVEGSGGDINR